MANAFKIIKIINEQIKTNHFHEYCYTSLSCVLRPDQSNIVGNLVVDIVDILISPDQRNIVVYILLGFFYFIEGC